MRSAQPADSSRRASTEEQPCSERRRAQRERRRAAPAERRAEPPPERVRDLAEACVRFVERAVGVKLDYEPRDALRPRSLPRAGARERERRSAGGGGASSPTRRAPTSARSCAGGTRRGGASRATTRPRGGSSSSRSTSRSARSQLVADALLAREASRRASADGDEAEARASQLELEEEDRDAVAARLAELPPVRRGRVLRAVDAARGDRHRRRRHPRAPAWARARRPTRALRPDDYEG